jgi:hypothetical protein
MEVQSGYVGNKNAQKNADEVKDCYIQLRVNSAVKEQYKKRALKSGYKTLTDWITSKLERDK